MWYPIHTLFIESERLASLSTQKKYTHAFGNNIGRIFSRCGRLKMGVFGDNYLD